LLIFCRFVEIVGTVVVIGFVVFGSLFVVYVWRRLKNNMKEMKMMLGENYGYSRAYSFSILFYFFISKNAHMDFIYIF